MLQKCIVAFLIVIGNLIISEAERILHSTDEGWSANSKSKKNDELEDLINSQSKNKCAIDLLYIARSLNNQWGLKLLDAFGKPDSGLLAGRTTWTGDYEECLSVTAPSSQEFLGFQGQHCWLKYAANIKGLPPKKVLHIGACLPNSCNSENLNKSQNLLVQILEKIPLVDKIVLNGTLLEITCPPEEQSWSILAIAVLSFCSLVVAVVIVATALDVYESRIRLENNQKCEEQKFAANESATNTDNDSEIDDDRLMLHSKEKAEGRFQKEESTVMAYSKKVLQSFSVMKNSALILDMTKKEGQLDCIHGIRFLSATWVIFRHTINDKTPLKNPNNFFEISHQWHFEVYNMAQYSVDSFFLISGFLSAYLFLKDNTQPKTSMEWISFYVHRYTRLTPVYAVVLLLYWSIFLNLGDGPFWENPDSTHPIVNCEESWWWNLLYINNFIKVNDECFGWAWYMANDMQFFIISPLFLLSLQRWPVFGIILTSSALLASWIARFFFVFDHGFILINGDPDFLSFWKSSNAETLYTLPYYRIGPYLVGILFAFYYLKTKDMKKQSSKYWVVLGWASATTVALSQIYGFHHSIYGTVVAAVYSAISQSIWAMCLGWVIIACVSGYGGPVNSILSCSFFFPLSRLTYCTYLIHPWISYWYFQSLRESYYFSLTNTIFQYLGLLMLGFGFAFVISLLFEVPVVVLEKRLKKIF